MKIQTGIVSTTHVDAFGDKMTKGALDGIAEQINSKYIPQLIDHDWNQHVGVNLYAEVFQLDDTNYAFGVVIGFFENESEKTEFTSGAPNIRSNDFQKYFDLKELQMLSANNEKTPQNENKLHIPNNNELKRILFRINSYSIMPDGTIYQIKELVDKWNGLKLYMYKEPNHKRPHIHVYRAEISASYALDNGEQLAGGKFKKKDEQHIFEYWLQDCKTSLLNAWNDLQEGKSIEVKL